jgi:four helix bundle protein
MYKSFKEMPIWHSVMKIAENIFFLTEKLPRKEDYGFTSQIRRAALSISANIAEAFGRNHILEKVHHYYFSRGSLTETQSHLEYGKRVGYIPVKEFEVINADLERIHKDLNKIIHTLKESA